MKKIVPWYDLNATRALPRIVEVDPRVLPEPWKGICLRNRIRPHAVILYENEGLSAKVWPASEIFARGIERGEDQKSDTAAESTSGNMGIGEAVVIEQLLERNPNFPVKRLVCGVAKGLQPEKIARLEAHKCIELIKAADSAAAMTLVQTLAREKGWWYTRQYWNEDNMAAYARPAHELVHQMPQLGLFAAGVGSGGAFGGYMKVLSEAFKNRTAPQKLYAVAVVVEPGQSVGGVRTEIGLMLDGTLGLPWGKYNDVRSYVGLEWSCKVSAALWEQSPGDPAKRIIGGESTGFALVGGLLQISELVNKGRLDALRDEAGDIQMAFLAADTRGPYAEDYAKYGIELPA